MKVAHAVTVTPNRCGLYETTRELVVGLRQIGIDSRMVEVSKKNKLHPGGISDRGAIFADMDWGVASDVIANHSGFDTTPLAKSKQPVIHVAHARPQSSFNSEKDGSTPVYSYHYRENKNPRFKVVVTFWTQHIPYLQVMWPDTPIHHVQAPVDLNAWTSNGPTGYKFSNKGGKINIVCTDGFRNDINPFAAINAYILWARGRSGTRLHIYGMRNTKGWTPLIRRMQDDGIFGELKPWVKGLANVYRAADALITSHSIDTRSVREAMACGCPIIRVPSATLNGYQASFSRALQEDRELVCKDAELQFNPTKTAKQFKEILEGL